jgi:hypothetical protein
VVLGRGSGQRAVILKIYVSRCAEVVRQSCQMAPQRGGAFRNLCRSGGLYVEAKLQPTKVAEFFRYRL